MIKVKTTKAETTVKDAKIAAGKKTYHFLLKGNPMEEYGVEVFCFVTFTAKDAELAIQRLEALGNLPGGEAFTCEFMDYTAEWFVGQDDFISELTEPLYDDGVMLLDTKQAALVKKTVETSGFRVGSGRMVLCPSTYAPPNAGVWWNCYEKHCDVEISTEMIYIKDLLKMAGK